jgi:hypothetical protein
VRARPGFDHDHDHEYDHDHDHVYVNVYVHHNLGEPERQSPTPALCVLCVLCGQSLSRFG